MPNEKVRGKYPNNLRAVREEKLLTRDQLTKLAEQLVVQDPVRFNPVSVSTIKGLELGWTRPRLKTAAVLISILQKPAEELFPAGLDDGNRHFLSSNK